MGRPSVMEERHEQIMQAAARCVVRYGLGGLTLERIAGEAGMSRGHVRHYAGNKDELVLALARWVHGRSDPSADAGAHGGELDTEGLLDYLYGDEFSGPSDENAVIVEFHNASRTNDALRQVMSTGYQQTLDEIYRSLQTAHPEDGEKRLRDRAYVMLSLAVGHAFLSDLDRSAVFGEVVRAAASELLTPLETTR